MPRPSSLGLLLAALACGPACITTTESQPPGIDDREVAQAAAVRSWLAQGPPGPALGCVVRLETPERGEGADGRFFFVVRNLYSQDLGLIDALGRAYRYRPHAAEPEVLGSGTVAEGAARILAADGPVDLLEIPIRDLEKRLQQELERKAADRRPATSQTGSNAARR